MDYTDTDISLLPSTKSFHEEQEKIRRNTIINIEKSMSNNLQSDIKNLIRLIQIYGIIANICGFAIIIINSAASVVGMTSSNISVIKAAAAINSIATALGVLTAWSIKQQNDNKNKLKKRSSKLGIEDLNPDDKSDKSSISA